MRKELQVYRGQWGNSLVAAVLNEVIRIVLHNHHFVLPRDLVDLPPPVGTHGAAAGVLPVRDDANGLYAAALLA